MTLPILNVTEVTIRTFCWLPICNLQDKYLSENLGFSERDLKYKLKQYVCVLNLEQTLVKLV